MSTSRDEVTKEDLLKKKSLIRHLYYDKNLTREQVKAELQKRGLNVNLPTLDSTMRAWGFEKNISKATWKSVASILGKRNQECKESEVIHCGKRVKPSRIKKETNRHQANSIFERLAQAQSPPPLSLGSQVAVCTPPPHPMEFQWQGDLPWQEFVKGEPYEKLCEIVTVERLTQRTEDGDSVMIQPNQCSALLNIGISYGPSLTPNESSLSVSKFAAKIGTTIPEAYPEENLRRAQSLLRGSRDEDFVVECLTLLIYAFSNNTIDPYSLEFNSQWKVALSIIKNSGILNRVIDLKRLNNITIKAFAENLLLASLYKTEGRSSSKFYEGSPESEAVAITIWLLKSGQDPNNVLLPAYGGFDHPQSPLQVAIVGGDVELVNHLLNAKADANIVPSRYGIPSSPLSPLEMAVTYRYGSILQLLLKHGASKNIDRALHEAIRGSNLQDARLLLDYGANPYAAYKTQGPVYENTALNVAAATGLQELRFVLGFVASQNPSKTPSSLITADTFVAAAKSNDSVAFFHHLLIENGADVNGTARLSKEHRQVLGIEASHEHASTPLACLIGDRGLPRNSNISCAIMLINAGATLTGLELFIAVTKSRLDLLSAALASGADPNAINNTGKRPLQLAIEALEEPKAEPNQRLAIIEELLHNQAIATQEEVIAGIECGIDSSLLGLLLSHGGNLLDPNKRGITPLEAAIYRGELLLSKEILGSYPRIYDPGSMCAALSTEMASIAQRLVANRPTQEPLNIVEMTALGMAAAHNFEVFQALLKYLSLPNVSYLPKGKAFHLHPFWRKSHSVLGSPLAIVARMCYKADRNAFSAFCELLQRGFQPDHRTWHAIVLNGEIDYAKALLDRGYELRPDELPTSHLDPLCESIRLGNSELFKIMLRAGAYFIRQHPHPIHLLTAIECAQWDMMESLLTAGATVNGYPPEASLQLSVNRRDLKVVNRLLDAGADVNQWNQDIKFGRSPLQSVIEEGNLEMIDRLLTAGAEVNAPPAPEGGATALQLAAMKGYKDLVELRWKELQSMEELIC
ncbi:hypothetical protein GQX73_g7032 [Xylaria multiplex]|uniref:Clr5 domain-containing protein n=1 Tax=Xylaria multiplex TaxID=323545 RepID=A0A7C8MR02_9PEZI|nr:hypothetical protein GQX73_g7032 [Xylaria multiplex]